MKFYSYLDLLLPEGYLVTSVFILFLLGSFTFEGKSGFWFLRICKLSIGLLFFYLYLIVMLPHRVYLVNTGFVYDFLGSFLKMVIVIIVLSVLLVLLFFTKYEKIFDFEFIFLLLFSLFGMLGMIMANDFLVLYLSMEIQSFCFYILSGLKKSNLKATEGALKYFVLGSLASGFFLYGISVLYGLTGSLSFDEIELLLVEFDFFKSMKLLSFGLLFILVGLFFKLGIAPFHMWVPDIYEASCASVTMFFSLVTKVVLVGVFIRILYLYGLVYADIWQNVFLLMGLLSVIVGAFGALFQTNFLRFIGYSSVNHAGYILIGLSLGTCEGLESALLYLCIYLILGLCLFLCMLSVYRVSDGTRIVEFVELKGLTASNPYLSLMLSLLLFSFAGIPPLLGFFGKFYIFMALINLKFYFVTFLLAFVGVISAFYYIRIIKVMYFEDVARYEFFTEVPVIISFYISFLNMINLFGLFFISPLVVYIKELVLYLLVG